MLSSWLADVVLGIHALFVVFVVLGGWLVLRRPKLAWIHGPAAVWGVLIEYAGFTCPLTPLEVAFRRRGGEAGYEGGFIQHYLTEAIYPSGLTREIQIGLGTLALVINVAIYWRMLRWQRLRARGPTFNREE